MASADSSRGKMEYIKEHRVHLLFEQLADKLLTTQPPDPLAFLIQQLHELQKPEPHKAAAPAATATSTATATAAPIKNEVIPATPVEKPQGPLKVTLAVFGLDSAGKSTMISAVAGEVDHNCVPTVGFEPSHFRSDAWDLRMFDLGGGAQFRAVWKEYYSELHGIIFVVDSANANRFAEAKSALWGILDDARAQGKPLLIFANKQDVAAAKTAREVEGLLGVQDLAKHHVFGCSAIADPVDENIEKGLEWLLEEVTKSFDDISARIKRQLEEDKQRRKKALAEQQKRVEEYRKVWDAEEQAKAAAKEAKPSS